MTPKTLVLTLVMCAALAGCGATVGDACTTESDCGGQVCLNRDYTPGGYCTKQCTAGDTSSCPGGSLCVSGIIAKDTPGCLHVCKANADCRSGYICRVVGGSSSAVCVGPNGL